MCEFVADDIDMTKLTPKQKEDLRKSLQDRRDQLIKRALELERVIYRTTQ